MKELNTKHLTQAIQALPQLKPKQELWDRLDKQLSEAQEREQTLDIVKDFYKASEEKNIERIAIADHIRYNSPLVSIEGKEAFMGFLGQMVKDLIGFDQIQFVADKNVVCVRYFVKSTLPIGNFTCTEWLTVEDGQIIDIKTYFDGTPFRAMGTPE